MLSSLGVGTYLGEPTKADDVAQAAAVVLSVHNGWNVIDTAANYREGHAEVHHLAAVWFEYLIGCILEHQAGCSSESLIVHMFGSVQSAHHLICCSLGCPEKLCTYAGGSGQRVLGAAQHPGPVPRDAVCEHQGRLHRQGAGRGAAAVARDRCRRPGAGRTLPAPSLPGSLAQAQPGQDAAQHGEHFLVGSLLLRALGTAGLRCCKTA